MKYYGLCSAKIHDQRVRKFVNRKYFKYVTTYQEIICKMAFVGTFQSGFAVCFVGKVHVFNRVASDDIHNRRSADVWHSKTIRLQSFDTKPIKDDRGKSAKKQQEDTSDSCQILCCRFSKSRARFAIASRQKKCFIFDIPSWEKISTVELSKAPTALEFTMDGREILVSDRAGFVSRYPIDVGQPSFAVEKDSGSDVHFMCHIISVFLSRRGCTRTSKLPCCHNCAMVYLWNNPDNLWIYFCSTLKK